MNKILRSSLITLISFIFVITALHAWTGPQVPPPDDNAFAPISVSATNQEKTGGLWLGSLGVTGKAISSSTVDSDPGNTLVTKDYLDARLAALSPAAPTTPIITSWSTPGTYSFLVPEGVTSLKVTVVGGGGGGGGGHWSMGSGGSGGGGAALIDNSVTVTPGQEYPVIVGAGGEGSPVSVSSDGFGGTYGTTGGSSSFGSLLMAPGGSGGLSGYTSAGAGGTGGNPNGYNGSANGGEGGSNLYSTIQSKPYGKGGKGGNGAYSGPPSVPAEPGTSGYVEISW